MSDSSIDVRDNTTGSSKTVASKLDSNSYHCPVHVTRTALSTDLTNAMVVLTDTSDTSLIAAPSSSPDLSYRNYVSSIQVANDSATGALIGIYDGAVGSPDQGIAYVYCPAHDTVSVDYPVPLQGTAATAIHVMANAAATLYVSAQGYIAA